MPTHYKGNPHETRVLNAYINLVRASGTLLARFTAHVEARGFTHGQFGVLEALLHLGPMCQKELGHKLLRSEGNITVVLDNLERRGWVCRERQKDDRRRVLVNLTTTGNRLISGYFRSHVQQIVAQMDRLNAKEQAELRRLCRKLGCGK
jgi:MarR family transcriptional regulator, 2-MHQ and catechol-resistance regulon repressor